MMIYIYDLIGAKSGCMYYNDAFCSFLRENNVNTTVISNYSDEYSKAWLFNIYKGLLPVKILKLFCNIVFLFILLLSKKNRIIYLSYGTSIDEFVLKLGCFSKRLYVDVHEYVQLDESSRDIKLKKGFDSIYKKIRVIIYHSQRTKDNLDRVSTKGELLFVPHFKYEFDKSYNPNSLPDEVMNIFHPGEDRIKILFFGHFRESKGIMVLIKAIKQLVPEVADKYHFIFAGADPHHTFEEQINSLSGNRKVSCVARYIETTELNYLFDQVDAVVLPYYEVSQSGVLETAVYFRKQLLLTDISYFSEFLSKFPSFGYLFNKGNTGALKQLFNSIASEGVKKYTDNDLRCFYKKDEYKYFLDLFLKYVK